MSEKSYTNIDLISIIQKVNDEHNKINKRFSVSRRMIVAILSITIIPLLISYIFLTYMPDEYKKIEYVVLSTLCLLIMFFFSYNINMIFVLTKSYKKVYGKINVFNFLEEYIKVNKSYEEKDFKKLYIIFKINYLQKNQYSKDIYEIDEKLSNKTFECEPMLVIKELVGKEKI